MSLPGSNLKNSISKTQPSKLNLTVRTPTYPEVPRRRPLHPPFPDPLPPPPNPPTPFPQLLLSTPDLPRSPVQSPPVETPKERERRIGFPNSLSQIEPARAYAQHLVATRLLDCLHDPAGQPSRMQGIRPRALLNCNPPAGTHRASAGAPSPACSGAWPKPIRIRLRTCGKGSPRSGMDSDLEAFSHNPADGSFAALPGQTAAKTNYLNPRFLSYWAELPLGRRSSVG